MKIQIIALLFGINAEPIVRENKEIENVVNKTHAQLLANSVRANYPRSQVSIYYQDGEFDIYPPLSEEIDMFKLNNGLISFENFEKNNIKISKVA